MPKLQVVEGGKKPTGKEYEFRLDGQKVGYAILLPQEGFPGISVPEFREQYSKINHFILDEQYRGRGLGPQFLGELEKMRREVGDKAIAAEAWGDAGFYERHGYDYLGTSKGEPTALFVKKL